MPSPAKNSATSGGSGAAALATIVASPRPSRDRIGRSTFSSAWRNSSARSLGVVLPNSQLFT